MKKFLSLLLCAGLLLAMAGCSRSDAKAEAALELLPPDDSAYTLSEDGVETPLDGGSATIAVVVSSAGVEDDAYNAALWRGVQAFCRSFNFMPLSFTLEADDADSAEQMLRQAAASGASMVVCAGSLMETAVYAVQNNYPTVSYLLLDGEPHNSDYSSYQTAQATHCVLFREEQIGYLAGYAAVMEGYTELGYLGTLATPEAVRYGTGYLQGAEAAAEQKGVQVNVKYWYSGTDTADENITARMSGWYAEGCQLVFAAGGTLAQSCAEAAQETGGRVIAAGCDQSSLGDAVLASSVKCFSRVVQQQLYAFYTGGARWGAEDAGTTETLGIAHDGVALVTEPWGFASFALSDYAKLYQLIRTSAVKVDRYSDTDAGGPDTPNLTVDYQNNTALD